MENETEVASFGGQVKTCGDNRVLSQWKSGMVKIYRREDGILNARMFLNVAPSRPTSQINVVPADLSVKSNRVIVSSAKGLGFYVRLNGAKEAEESRNMINQLCSYECSKRSKAEVCSLTPVSMKVNAEIKLNTNDSSRMRLSTSANTPLRMKYRGTSLSPQVRVSSPLEASTYPQKRRSSEMDDSNHDNNGNFTGVSDKRTVFTSVKDPGFKAPRMLKSTDTDSFRGLTSSSFYGKSKGVSRLYGIKEPVRQQSFDNLGNTCFINSPLQCLSSLEPLSLDIQEVVQQYGQSLKKESVIRLLCLLMKYVRKHNLHGVKIKTILKVLRETLFGKFAVNTQQDAHELLSEILDQVHEEIQELKLKEERREEEEDSEEAGEESEQADSEEGMAHHVVSQLSPSREKRLKERLSRHILSPTEKNFTWFFKNSFHYHDCNRRIWSQEERDTTLMLAFSSQMHLHLQDCVDDYFKSCDVEFKCESCDKNEAATITRKIIKRPRCLILNLLRYQTDSLESKKKLDSVSIPRYISIADFCTEDVKDPLYINPVFMSDNCTDDADESILEFLLKTQEEMMKSEFDNNKSQNSFTRAPGDPPKTKDTSDSEVKDKSTQFEISLPESSNNTGHKTTNSPVSMGEDPTNDVNVENNSSDSAKRKSPTGSSQDREEAESDDIPTHDSLKKRKLEERLRCRGGSVDGLTPIKGYVGDAKTLGEIINLNNQIYDRNSQSDVEPSFRDDSASTKESYGAKDEMDEDASAGASAGYEASSEGDSNTSCKSESASKLQSGNNPCHVNSVNVVKKVNNWQANSIMSEHTESTTRLSPIDEGQVSESEDIDNQILCGRRLCEYLESDLQALDVNMLNDNEMMLYAQALSRFEYVKEKRAAHVAVSAASSVLDDFADCSSLEFEHTGFHCDASYPVYETSQERTQDFENLNIRAGASGLSNCGDSSSSRVRGVISKRGKTEKFKSPIHVTVSEADSMFLECESIHMSPPAASKVPDIFETSPETSFREEAFFRDEVECEDEKKKNSNKVSRSLVQGTAKVPSSPISYDGHVLGDVNNADFQTSQTSSSQRLEKCIFCDGPISAGQCSKCDSAAGDFGCVPMDETFNVDDGNISEDVFVPDQFSSKSNILSDKGNTNRGMESPSKILQSPFFHTSIGSSTIWANPSSSPSPPKIDRDLKPTSSTSTFEKSKPDMFMASPSKTKNLVKTRDYSRLRSPITSPRKRLSKASPSKKSPAANKQLIFPESDKLWDKNLKSPSSPSVSSSSERMRLATTELNTDTISNEETESISSVAMDNSSMIEQNDKLNESDSSYQLKQVTSFSNSVSQDKPLSKLEAINTSTPITSTQETYSKNFQQPLHISVTPAPSYQSKEMVTKSTATPSVSPSSSQQKVQTVPTSCDAPQRSKASRSLTVSFAAAEEKENSGASNEEEQSRRKRLAHIESGESECSYRLVGVVNHHGESLFAGHYTSFSFNLHKQKWFYLDDKHTRDTTEMTARRDSMCNGYVFFYMDKDLFDLYSSMKDASS